MLKFIIDTQLPPKLAKYLRDKDLHTVHTTYYPISNVERLSFFDRDIELIVQIFSDGGDFISFNRTHISVY